MLKLWDKKEWIKLLQRPPWGDRSVDNTTSIKHTSQNMFHSVNWIKLPETYSEHCQTSKMERFAFSR